MRIFNLIITTKKKYEEQIQASYLQGDVDATVLEQRSARSAVIPVIHDLEKLRANTWDQDKISKMQEWLRLNFGDEE